METTKNRIVTELHGCIVCAKVHSMLVVYSPEGKMVDCTVESGGAQRVPDAQQPLVACNTHSSAEIEAAHQRWESRNEPKEEEE